MKNWAFGGILVSDLTPNLHLSTRPHAAGLAARVTVQGRQYESNFLLRLVNSPVSQLTFWRLLCGARVPPYHDRKYVYNR